MQAPQRTRQMTEQPSGAKRGVGRPRRVSAYPKAVDELRRTLKIVGLKDFETPTLDQVERRRYELLALVFFVFMVLVGGLALLSSRVRPPEWIVGLGATADIIRGLLLALSVGIVGYVVEKERNLGKLQKMLTNERVLSAALSNRLKEISSLAEAGKAVAHMLEIDDVLNVILNAAFELLEANEGSVMLAEEDELVVAAAAGYAGKYLGARRPVSEGLGGYVARTREPLLIEGRPDLSEFGAPPSHSEGVIESAMCVPLEADGELFGVLNLNVTHGARRYNEYDLQALKSFGEHAAIAIRRARVLRKEREMRVRIAELDRVRSELVGSMAHDLKTPLTTIVGVAKLLLQKEDETSPNKRRQLIESVERQAVRLLGLIERLLDAARSQARYLPLNMRELELVGFLRSITEAYASAHERPIGFDTNADNLSVWADPDAVEQIVANLLENAFKHTDPTAAISVSVVDIGREAEVSVADRGPGIALEDRRLLFEPFRRGEVKGSGVGLGLFIVANLVRSMGGEIRVDSTHDEGTTFTFTIPFERREVPGVPEEPPRVLVAGDGES